MIQRKAVRAVIMTPDHRVLLMKLQEPVTGFQLWITPGGGLKPDESEEEGLRREVAEETGVRNFCLDHPYGPENTNSLGTVEAITKMKSIISYKQTNLIQ